MPIDKFGRHLHYSRHRVYPQQILIITKNISDLYYEVPLLINGFKTDETGHFKIGMGSSEYTFPLQSARVSHVRKNIAKIQTFVNTIEIKDLVGVTLKFGDVLRFKLPNGNKADVNMGIELILKCPLNTATAENER